MRSSPTPSVATSRILIVDDDADNREILEMVLEREGFVIVCAGTGGEACALVTQDPPHLILLDLMMPDMTGYAVVALLKGNPTTRDIPIVMLSAMADHPTRLRALRAGATDFITKPVGRAELCARVKAALRPDARDLPQTCT